MTSDVRLRVALAGCLVVGAGALVVTLSKSPIAVAGMNTPKSAPLGIFRRPLSACQSGEVLPGGTSAIRLHVDAFLGPRVAVAAVRQGEVVTHGERGSGWTGGVVTVPVKPVSTTVRDVDLCFTIFGNRDEGDELSGERTRGPRAAFNPTSGRRALTGRLEVEYLHASRASWWSLVPGVARRLGFGRASGSWNALIPLALMGLVLALCSRQILRGLG